MSDADKIAQVFLGSVAVLLAVAIGLNVATFVMLEELEGLVKNELIATTEPTTEPETEPVENASVGLSAALEATIPETTQLVEAVLYFDVPLSEELQDHIFRLCDERGIDPAVIIAMIFQESTYNSSAIGDNGNSYGLMQIQPRWNQARMDELNCHDLLDPFQNVTVGIDILGDYLTQGSLEWSLMAYNGGPSYASNNVANGVVSGYAKNVIYNSSMLERG